MYEGFLNVWTHDEESSGPQWRVVWVQLKSGHFKGYDDPRTQSILLFDIEVTGELNIRPMVSGRRYSFDLRDFSGRTVLAANCQADMDRAIQRIKDHKQHLKSWGRLIGSNQLDESNVGGTPVRPPWSGKFLGSKKRRSRSVDAEKLETPKPSNVEGEIIAQIVQEGLRQRRTKRRSRSVDGNKKKESYRPPPSLPSMEDTLAHHSNELFISDEPKSLPVPSFEHTSPNGPRSLPKMMNLLNVDSRRQIDQKPSVMRTSTKINNPDLRMKYSDLSDLSPISSPSSTLDKVPTLSPVPAARLISPKKKQSRDSFANAMRNQH